MSEIQFQDPVYKYMLTTVLVVVENGLCDCCSFLALSVLAKVICSRNAPEKRAK